VFKASLESVLYFELFIMKRHIIMIFDFQVLVSNVLIKPWCNSIRF